MTAERSLGGQPGAVLRTVGSGERVSMPPSARMRAQACMRKGVTSSDSAVTPAAAAVARSQPLSTT